MNSFLANIGKFMVAGALAAFLVACGDKTSNVTPSGDEPRWVNSLPAAKEAANAMVVAVGSAKLLDGNVDYATNQAAMNARIQIAQTVSVKVEQAIKSLAQSDGLKIADNTLQAAKQKVELNLQQTQIAERWVDKKSNPQILYVLVAMDKDAYDRALKGGTQMLNINDDQARRLSDAVEDLLK